VRRLRVGLWSFLAVLCFAGGCLRDHGGSPTWRVGQWVRYDVTSHGDTWLLEYALVGEDRNGGSQLFWLEARRLDVNDSLFVKCLVPSGLEGPAEEVVIGGNSLSSRLSVNGSHLPWTTERMSPNIERGKRTAHVEDLETPAGRFPTQKYECPAGEIWFSPRVPLFGIVRSKNLDVEMVLVAYGLKGATSELKEAPETETITY